ncbi:hypothetical protein ACFE04_008636 [Oxalis oulophora]
MLLGAIVFTINTPTTTTTTTSKTDSSSVAAAATVTYESKSPKTQNQLFSDQPTSKNHSFRQPLQTPTDEEYGQQYYDDEYVVAPLKQASKVKSRPKSPKKACIFILDDGAATLRTVVRCLFRQPSYQPP